MLLRIKDGTAGGPFLLPKKQLLPLVPFLSEYCHSEFISESHIQTGRKRTGGFFMEKFNTLTLLKKLLALPSFVDDKNDEQEILTFLVTLFQTALPMMSVQKQYVDKRRYNIIVKGRNEPKLFVLGHVDTVQPKVGWQTNPFQPLVKQNNVYGLGASDMKGSLAAFVSALLNKQTEINLDNLMLLLYVDEEYDFKGIKKFLASSESDNLLPKLMLSLDGTLAVGNGCRGIIELRFILNGKSGHSSNPKNGINVIRKTEKVLQNLEKQLGMFKDRSLGKTTVNLAYLQGGVIQESNGERVWQREGNIIPNFAEIIIEVRPATKEVTAQFIIDQLRLLTTQQGLTIQEINIRHDIAPWPVFYPTEELQILKKIYRQANVPFKKAVTKLRGYVDVQMLTESIPVPTVIIGTGGVNKHDANEYVPLKKLEDATKIYKKILEKFL